MISKVFPPYAETADQSTFENEFNPSPGLPLLDFRIRHLAILGEVVPEPTFTAALVIPLDGAGVEHDATPLELDGGAVDAVRGVIPIAREGRGRGGIPVGERDTGKFRRGGGRR